MLRQRSYDLDCHKYISFDYIYQVFLTTFIISGANDSFNDFGPASRAFPPLARAFSCLLVSPMLIAQSEILTRINIEQKTWPVQIIPVLQPCLLLCCRLSELLVFESRNMFYRLRT